MKKLIILSLILFSVFNLNSYIIGANLFISDSSKSFHKLSPEEYQKHLRDLDKYNSIKKLGSFFESGKTIFRLFAPRLNRCCL